MFTESSELKFLLLINLANLSFGETSSINSQRGNYILTRVVNKTGNNLLGNNVSSVWQPIHKAATHL